MPPTAPPADSPADLPASPAADTLPPSVFSRRDSLTWLFLFRLLLAAVLIVLFSFPEATPWLTGEAAQQDARLLLSAHAVLILLSGFLVIARWPGHTQQVQLAVFIDIGLYLLLLHLGGGLTSGLGLLPGIAVTVGALLLVGRQALLFAALASLGVITQQVYAELYLPEPTGTYTQAGLLGLTYFLIAMLAHVLMSRLRDTESLAERRGLDLADLSQLNDYIIQNFDTGVVVIDGDRQVRLCNAAARRLLGTPTLEAGDALFPRVPALEAWLTARLQGDGPAEPVMQFGDHEVRPQLQFLGQRRAHGALLFLRDHQALLRQAQEIKLAALGRLTASIAHNIRNPLSSVNHAAQLLAESEALAEDDRQLLDMIRRNALRIDETVTSVLELSRRSQASPLEIDLGGWLTEFRAEYLEGNRLNESVLTLSLPAAAGPLPVQVDPRHLGQIMRNLCDNARKHGAREGEPPRVDLTVEPGVNPGEVVLTVADHGPGVPEALQRNIFEPFFTTSSSGTGLGLFAAREFAEANGIRLEYRDAPGGGGAFRLAFSH